MLRYPAFKISKIEHFCLTLIQSIWSQVIIRSRIFTPAQPVIRAICLPTNADNRVICHPIIVEKILQSPRYADLFPQPNRLQALAILVRAWRVPASLILLLI